MRREPGLLARPFPLAEIYPPDLFRGPDPKAMCGTPIAGGTLLHLAIDFDEQEDLRLAAREWSRVNAAATVDASGFGGHTPLFNAVVSQGGCKNSAAMGRALLARGRTARTGPACANSSTGSNAPAGTKPWGSPRSNGVKPFRNGTGSTWNC